MSCYYSLRQQKPALGGEILYHPFHIGASIDDTAKGATKTIAVVSSRILGEIQLRIREESSNVHRRLIIGRVA